MDGLVRCSRYAFGPNRLHYCGPDANREILGYINENNGDFGLKTLLQQFNTMYPYLFQIAKSNGIKNPFDDKVVEAYWLGNRLLDNVSKKEFYNNLVDNHKLKQKINAKSFSAISDLIAQGALPHHSFHVFAIWKRTGNLTIPHTIETMDACRISYGQVILVDGPFLIVKTRPLILREGKLALGLSINKKIARSLDARDDIGEIKSGDNVSMHWNVPCEVITQTQSERLKKYTIASISFANQII